MQAERARRAAAGWAVDDIPRKCSFFFCELENERVCVSIECFEPGCGELAGVADTTVRRHIELSGFRKGVITRPVGTRELIRPRSGASRSAIPGACSGRTRPVFRSREPVIRMKVAHPSLMHSQDVERCRLRTEKTALRT
jgi:hypothetical protein